MSQPIIGIDLGTTNSVVAVVREGDAEVLRGPDGNGLFPSVVAYLEEGGEGAWSIGPEAKRQASVHPKSTVYSIKRFIGMRYAESEGERESVSYDVLPDGNREGLKVRIGGRSLTPIEVSAKILERLKQRAEEAIGEAVECAVVTVPAYFNDAQRQATAEAGRLAGLRVERIINEPTAASLAYGLGRDANGRVAVYDLGGGTFDISILELKDGIFEVLSTSGDTHLGGDDIDRRIMDWARGAFEREHGIAFPDSPPALARLREAAEQVKCQLSMKEEARLSVPFTDGDGGRRPVHFETVLTRETLVRLAQDLFERTRSLCLRALEDAGVKAQEIDHVVLVGGSTRIPAVVDLVQDLFARDPEEGINPDEVVAVGAAIQGSILAGGLSDLLLLDVTPLSLGIETIGGVMSRLIHRNTTIPTSATELFTTYLDNQTSVDIHVLQGEREMVKDNWTLARFELRDIPPMPAGLPQIEVEFLIDQNGILNVSAKEKRSGRAQSVEVRNTVDIQDERVQEMVRESIKHAEGDMRRRQLVEARNKAGQVMAAVKKTLESASVEMPDEEAEAIRDAYGACQAEVEGEDTDLIRRATEGLDRVTTGLAERMMEAVAAKKIEQESGRNR